VLRRLEFHYASQHASWLNMVEIEIGVLRSHVWTGDCHPRAAYIRDRRLGTRRKRFRSPHQMDVHNRKARAKMGLLLSNAASAREQGSKSITTVQRY